jgi:hypothetical protein
MRAISGGEVWRDMVMKASTRTTGTLTQLSELEGDDASYSQGELSSELTQSETLRLDLKKENAAVGGVARKRVPPSAIWTPCNACPRRHAWPQPRTA